MSIGPGSAGLPLAAARNAGAYAARAGGAELLIFLDVDCLPGADLVKVYADAAADRDRRDPALRPGRLPATAAARAVTTSNTSTAIPSTPAGPPRRPAPGSAAATTGCSGPCRSRSPASAWDRIGGFCERYQGYGAEDTDFAMLAQSRGVDLTWVGGAAAYHQWHPTSTPPLPHLDDLLRNGRLFAERWGWWPMEGWFDQFAALGLVRPAEDGDGWIRTAGPTLAVSA